MNLKLINLLLLVLIKLVSAENDQLINFVPDTNDFDLIASETNQYSSVVDLTTDDYLKECVEAHNAKRRLHGVDDLVYDEKLLEDAKEAAAQSALNGKLISLLDSPWGENLASSSRKLTCSNAVNLWYKQNKFYNYHVPIYSKLTGGFTQLVWRETTRFACAQARLKNASRFFTVCTYDPFGNVSGQFRANVSPPIAVNNNNNNNKPNSVTSSTLPYSASTTTRPTTTESVLSSSTSSTSLTRTNNLKTNNEINNSTLEHSSTSSSLDNVSNLITNSNSSEVELSEATLNTSPNETPNSNEPNNRPSSLVKPILNKSYRLSPGMLIKLKNLNRRKLDEKQPSSDDKLVASASELNLFVKLNTISPTLDTMEISNTIQQHIKKNDTFNPIQSAAMNIIETTTTTTTNSNLDNNDNLLTTFRSF